MYKISEDERQYLMDSLCDLLEEYDYDCSSWALDRIIDEWASQKQPLIEAFKKHPNYVEGKFMIAFSRDYERPLDVTIVRKFSHWLDDGVMGWGVTTLPEEINQRRIADDCPWLPNNVYRFFYYLDDKACHILDDETASYINEIFPNIKARAGQKMSRVVNKICVYLGYDKHPEYNREFAKFADALNPLTIKRHTVLSINPLDYLTMSFGNSWASCHTIDKQNKRDMPNSYSGMYSSGTVSYMLDSSSMVLYTVEAQYDGTDYWNQPKIHRQMFHWGEEKLVQGRLYPQSNDSGADEYTTYRNLVQEIFSQLFDFDNLWVITKGTDAASRYIISHGTHYTDYQYFSNCTLSRIKGNENVNNFVVGATPICINCGDRHMKADNIDCCKPDTMICEDCGCVINEDEAIWVGNYVYCRDCVSYCDYCEEYHREESHWINRDDISVCESCLNEYYVYCPECDDYVDRDDAVYDEIDGEYYCLDHAPNREEEEEEEE